jgi:hypothetical protein
MGVDKTALIVPGHGTLFIADANTAVPASPLTAFTLKGTPPDGWENIGHTSTDNTAAFNRDGGDATQLDSWLEDGVETIYAATNWSLNFNPIQVDKNSLDLGFNGWVDTDGGYVIPSTSDGLDKALFLLATDGTGSLGFYMPDTNVNIGDAPSIDNAKFFEIPLAASIHAADESVIASNSGKSGLMKVYKTGLTALAPSITSVSPDSGATVGDLLTFTGSSFTGTTAVKFGSTTATFAFVSDSQIVAIVPSGATGTVAVKVTNAAGTSSAFNVTLTS